MLVNVHLVIHPYVEFALIAYYLSLNKFHCLAAGSVAASIKWKAIGILCRCGRAQLKCDGTCCCTGGEVKGKLANGVGSHYPSHYLGTWCIQHYYR